MSSKKVLVVFGATGNQGGSVIDVILSDPITAAQFQFRAITRDPSKPSSVAIGEKGVELVKADLDDKESLRLALKDAYAVFAMTNWPEIMNKEREIRQGKNIADVSKELHIQHLIWSTLPYVSKITNNKITGVHHFETKAIVEEYISSIGIPYTSIQLGIFMQYMLFMLQPISLSTPKSYKLSLPVPSTTKIPLISVNKDTGKYVKAILLNQEKMLGKKIFAGEKMYTLDEATGVLKNVGGLNVKFVQCPDKEYRQGLEMMGMPDFFKDDMSDSMKFVGGYDLFDGVGVEEGQKMLTEPVESFEEWLGKSEMVAAMR